MRCAAVGLFLCSSVLWAGSLPKPSEILVITNVNVIDTRYGGILPNATVIIRDGVIAAVSKIAVLNTGTHEQVINAEGKYIIPGLWDMNTHLANAAAEKWDRAALLALYVVNGVTGIRDQDSPEQAGAGRLDPEIIIAASARPATTSPLFERHSVDGLNEVFEACSAAGQGWRAPTVGHPDTLAQTWIAEEPNETYDRKKAWDLFLKMSDHATWMVPSLVSLGPHHEIYQWLHPDAVLSGVTVPGNNDTRQAEMETGGDAMQALNLVTGMRRAGVQFLAGTNGPRADVLPGTSLHQELELLVAAGFTPFQALQAATFNPALSMAKLDKYGVVEAGHVGNLVLLEANPLTEIRNTQKIAGVVVRGAYLSRADLDDMLAKAEQELHPHPDTANAGEWKSTPW